MRLQEFVKQTLVEITEGVKGAQDECSKHGALINPRCSMDSKASTANVTGGVVRMSTVKFNVAVTNTKGKGSNTKIGVLFSNLGIGNERVNGDLMESANIIQFEVPIVYPIIESDTLSKKFDGILIR